MASERYNEEFKVAAVKQVTKERDILKEAAVFFAAESKKNTRS